VTEWFLAVESWAPWIRQPSWLRLKAHLEFLLEIMAAVLSLVAWVKIITKAGYSGWWMLVPVSGIFLLLASFVVGLTSLFNVLRSRPALGALFRSTPPDSTWPASWPSSAASCFSSPGSCSSSSVSPIGPSFADHRGVFRGATS
jgi:hypothetical protein